MGSYQASADVSIATTTAPRRLWRIAGLAGLLAAELLLISAHTPHVALQDAPGLAGLVFSLGAWKVRLLVTLAVIALLLWESRGQQSLAHISKRPIGMAFSWLWLAGHVIAILSFTGLTGLLFEN